MGGATRLMMLLTTPFPLYPRHSSLLRLAAFRLSSSLTPSKSSISRHHQSQITTTTGGCGGGGGGGEFSIKASSGHIHTQANTLSSRYDDSGSNSWPEWGKLVDGMAAAGYFGRRATAEVDGFVETELLANGFLDSGSAILAFARNRPELLRALSRKDIEVVVQSGSPFLFKDALDSTRRMRLFLDANGSNAVESDRAHTIDLVKFLLSFASNPALASERDNIYNREFVESSVRNLLSELAALSCSVPESNISAPLQKSFPDRYEQTPRPLGQNIEMKRGDWICPKCSFMNFARNTKCLECEEARPKRQLAGGEWECPQCDFFNYGRNSVCLRCDCKCPRESSFVTTPSMSSQGYTNISYSNKAEIDSRLAANEEKAERWFNKVSQLESSTDLSSAAADEDFPEIMPLRKGVNRFVVSTRKTPLERRLANAHYHQNDAPESNGSQTETTLGRSLDEILGRTSAGETAETKTPVSASAGDSLLLSDKPVNQTENKEKEIEQAEKSERWFKKVAELHDVTDLASAISDDDFPQIMPMRKGENRFVVSKKKDRSLTSPMYKRRAAMEQASSTNFVPFVPFPPDYFAKKDKPQPEKDDKTAQTESPNAPDKSIDAKTLVPERDQQNPSNSPASSNQSVPGSSSSQQIENTNVRERWMGKSLEGSAVKEEPDPLDMSEEAKAERWFRRVAQIKDISELSQIPDEDFPSIMPMRKGVNRFVVSKRKTPLERRLTSPQYRRNLPIMSSDPTKNENDSS